VILNFGGSVRQDSCQKQTQQTEITGWQGGVGSGAGEYEAIPLRKPPSISRKTILV